MLSNDLTKLLLICFFVYVSPVSTVALNKDGVQETSSGHGQEPHILHEGSYLIIGVFEHEINARQLVNQALQEGLEAHYSLHSKNRFFYVYTYSDSSKADVLKVYHKTRMSTSYKDAWILTIQAIAETPQAELQINSGETKQEDIEPSQPEKAYALLPEHRVYSDKTVVAFYALNQKTAKEIDADIQVMDSRNNKRIEPLDANDEWIFTISSLPSDTLQVKARAMGYCIFEKALSLDELLQDHTATMTHFREDTLFVRLALEELEAGDVQIMYNTYFYGNSTVMRIQSKHELDEVYNILQQHPDMKIRLHGHTNGNSRGVAYLYLEKAKNFFELVRTKEYQKRGVSSTTLSASRAETIKSYLTYRGIAPERIEAIGWGGKKMLYEPDSPMAKNNIRVEIEVLTK